MKGFFYALLLLSAACSCEEPETFNRVCPGVTEPVGPVNSETVKDDDQDGYAICAGDCDDSNVNIFPGATEICDGIDQDCDGSVDEQLVDECWTGSRTANLGSDSRCKPGVSICENGEWSDCREQIFPVAEICNEIDDDCDGDVDEPVPHSCGPDPRFLTGRCRLGDQICSGLEMLCTNAIYPENEICNAVDDDCDGNVDEELIRRCSTACGTGIETCRVGIWKDCDARQPVDEICNGLDDDCDGVSDEGLTCLCEYSADPAQNQISLCQTNITCGIGISMCQPDGTWGPCAPYQAVPEACNNWDDDCDGIVDEFDEPCGDRKHAGIGVCILGQRTCTAGQWGECTGDIGPTDEICDSLDNDCDGRVDEDLDAHDAVDVWFEIDGSGSMCGYVNALALGASLWATEFRGTNHRFGLGVFPGMSLSGPQLVNVLTPLTDIDSFLTALSTYDCYYGSIEPGWDTMWTSADPTDPLGIGWRAPDPSNSIPELRAGAWPYIIHIGDENPGVFGDPNEGLYYENDVTAAVTNCGVGACIGKPGKFETFVLTKTFYFEYWDEPTFNETERLIDIDPASEIRYVAEFRKILRKLCR